jgi:hypothetical protein
MGIEMLLKNTARAMDGQVEAFARTYGMQPFRLQRTRAPDYAIAAKTLGEAVIADGTA